MSDDVDDAVHDLDATLRVGKRGPDAVTDELDDQLADRDVVKVRFLRSALGGSEASDLAADLADATGASVVDVRGHTAVFRR